VSRRPSTKLCCIGGDHSWCRGSGFPSELIDIVDELCSLLLVEESLAIICLLSSACSTVVVTPCQHLFRVQGMMPYFLAVAEILMDSWVLRSAIALSIALTAAEISPVEVLLLLLLELCIMWVCARCGKVFYTVL
jgi:hypothetical protein